MSAIDVAQALFGVGRGSPNPTRILLYSDDKNKSLFKLNSCRILRADEKMNSRKCVGNDSAVLFRFMLRERYRRHVVASALTFRDFVPRLELLTHYRDFLGISGILGDFQKSVKMYERNYFSLFCKSYLILFLSFIIGTPILC